MLSTWFSSFFLFKDKSNHSTFEIKYAHTHTPKYTDESNLFPPENPFSGRVGLPQRRRTSRATAAPAERPRCRTPVHSSQARPPKGSLLAHPCRGLPSMLGSVRLPHPYLHTLSCPISSLPQLCFSTQRACSNADSGAGSLGCSLRTCISHELPGDANAAGPLTSAGSQAGPRLLKSQRSTLRERKAQSQASLDSQPGCFSHRALGPRQMASRLRARVPHPMEVTVLTCRGPREHGQVLPPQLPSHCISPGILR